jgi:hypothetical protein
MTDARPLSHWVREGLRATLLRAPRIGGERPNGSQLLAVFVICSLIEVGLGRLEVVGPAEFSWRAWLAPWWSAAALAVLMFVLADAEPRLQADGSRAGILPAWFTLWFVAMAPASTVWQALSIALAYGVLPDVLSDNSFTGWMLYVLMVGWMIAIAWTITRAFGFQRDRLVVMSGGLLAIFIVSTIQFPERPWTAPPETLAEAESPGVVLRPESFEGQLAALQKSIDALAPQRPGVPDVYGLVFSPYASEDVFLRESAMVAHVLAERFDANGRVLHLVNHASTLETQGWATTANLQRAVQALAERMDRDEDVLVVYLTSHGASDFQLAAAHPPMRVDTLSPSELRSALDNAGIKHRVIAISACYSGGWVPPLAGDTTLVMTAADRDHTSYGCGKLSELTFFGRAMFDEQLRKTRSFEQAFAAAVPVIKQREVEAGKPDGFSNPQISVGEGIRGVLRALEQRLEAVPAKP